MVSTLDSESSDPSSNLGGTWNVFSFFLCVRGRPRSYLKRPKDERDKKSRSNTKGENLILLRLYFAPKEYFSYDNPRDRFSKSPLFFSGWSCHFKRLFLPVWREIHLSKILPVTLWQFTDRTVSVFHVAPDISYVNLFFPREFLIWFKSIQAKQVYHETSSFARSLRDLMHWSSLCSHLRTYERSNCSKSIAGTIK